MSHYVWQKQKELRDAFRLIKVRGSNRLPSLQAVVMCLMQHATEPLHVGMSVNAQVSFLVSVCFTLLVWHVSNPSQLWRSRTLWIKYPGTCTCWLPAVPLIHSGGEGWRMCTGSCAIQRLGTCGSHRPKTWLIIRERYPSDSCQVVLPPQQYVDSHMPDWWWHPGSHQSGPLCLWKIGL